MISSRNTIISIVFFACCSQVSAQSPFDCGLLVGTWVGEHRYEDGEFNSWRAVYADGGQLSIEFYDESENAIGAQSGIWECDGNWVTTQMQDQGQSFEFSYQIRELDIFRYVYESAQGPVFTSYRRPSN